MEGGLTLAAADVAATPLSFFAGILSDSLRIMFHVSHSMTPKAIIFDFGQTLADSAGGFRTAEKEAETKIFADLGLESWPDFLTHYRQFRQEFHSRSNFSRRAIWWAVYLHYGREPDQESLLAAERNYWETVKSKTRPFPEAAVVLAQLATNYRLALITNSQGQPASEKHRLALFPELAALFEVIIVAGEAGLPPKPQPEPFLLCLEKLSLAPAEAIYVGDDWRIDICGAQEVGMQPVWLQHHSVSRKWPSVETSVPIITSLEQLLNLDPPDLASSPCYFPQLVLESNLTSGDKTHTAGDWPHTTGGMVHTTGGQVHTYGGQPHTHGGMVHTAGGQPHTQGGIIHTPGGAM